MSIRTSWPCLSVLALLGIVTASGEAQQPQREPRPLTLAEAIRLASQTSEEVAIARAGVTRARGEEYRARSELYPQVFGSASYTRTLASEFGAFGDDGDEDAELADVCGPFRANPALPTDQRLDSLEAAVACQSTANPFGDLFENLPFGRVNQVNLGLTGTQTVYAGGRVRAQTRIARAGRRSADISVAAASARVILDATQAYYNAQLSDQLLAIAEATLAQADTTLTQVRLAVSVGEQPEFELLRAQVTRDNQRPVVISRRAERDIAYTRLRQLLNLPLGQPITLITPLDSDTLVPVVAREVRPDTSVAARAPVRQAEEAVTIQQNLERVARSQRIPNLSLSSQFGRVAYPVGGIPVWSEFRSNWTVSAILQVPIFTGGRIRGDQLVARGNTEQARAQLQQVRELAALEARNVLDQLAAAQAAWVASAGTVEQARRAYAIAELRYREGVSTQLELTDARIMLEQARANRAVAARDLQIARATVVLLPDLPLGASGFGASLTAPAPGGAALQLQAQSSMPLQTQGQRTTQAAGAGAAGVQLNRAGVRQQEDF